MDVTFYGQRGAGDSREIRWVELAGPDGKRRVAVFAGGRIEGALQEHLQMTGAVNTPSYGPWRQTLDLRLGEAGGGLIAVSRPTPEGMAVAISCAAGNGYAPPAEMLLLPSVGAPQFVALGEIVLAAGARLILPTSQVAEAELRQLRQVLRGLPPDLESLMLDVLRRPSLEDRMDRIEQDLAALQGHRDRSAKGVGTTRREKILIAVCSALLLTTLALAWFRWGDPAFVQRQGSRGGAAVEAGPAAPAAGGSPARAAVAAVPGAGQAAVPGAGQAVDDSRPEASGEAGVEKSGEPGAAGAAAAGAGTVKTAAAGEQDGGADEPGEGGADQGGEQPPDAGTESAAAPAAKPGVGQDEGSQAEGGKDEGGKDEGGEDEGGEDEGGEDEGGEGESGEGESGEDEGGEGESGEDEGGQDGGGEDEGGQGEGGQDEGEGEKNVDDPAGDGGGGGGQER